MMSLVFISRFISLYIEIYSGICSCSWSMTYEDLLSTNDPFSEPIPLPVSSLDKDTTDVLYKYLGVPFTRTRTLKQTFSCL